MDRGAWWAKIQRVAKSWTWLSNWPHNNTSLRICSVECDSQPRNKNNCHGCSFVDDWELHVFWGAQKLPERISDFQWEFWMLSKRGMGSQEYTSIIWERPSCVGAFFPISLPLGYTSLSFGPDFQTHPYTGVSVWMSDCSKPESPKFVPISSSL